MENFTKFVINILFWPQYEISFSRKIIKHILYVSSNSHTKKFV